MAKVTTLNVRIGGELSRHVAANVGESGSYDNASEYVRALIRRDKQEADELAFERLKTELQAGFAAGEDSYVELSADDVIARNRR